MIMPRLRNAWRETGFIHFFQTSSWSFIHTHFPGRRFFAFPTSLTRCTALYMAMLSCQTLDWCLENLGLGQMDVFTNIMLRMWSTHPNPVIKHHVGAQVTRGRFERMEKTQIVQQVTGNKTKDWCWELILLMDNIQANQLSIINIPVLAVQRL